MSRKREPVRRIKGVLRLAYLEALSERQIALGANMKKTTVHDYLLRARRALITWSEVQSMDDDGIEQLLFPRGRSFEEAQECISTGYKRDRLWRRASSFCCDNGLLTLLLGLVKLAT